MGGQREGAAARGRLLALERRVEARGAVADALGTLSARQRLQVGQLAVEVARDLCAAGAQLSQDAVRDAGELGEAAATIAPGGTSLVIGLVAAAPGGGLAGGGAGRHDLAVVAGVGQGGVEPVPEHKPDEDHVADERPVAPVERDAALTEPGDVVDDRGGVTHQLAPPARISATAVS